MLGLPARVLERHTLEANFGRPAGGGGLAVGRSDGVIVWNMAGGYTWPAIAATFSYGVVHADV